MFNKTIVFLNLRFSDFYSHDLIKRVKQEKQVRMIAVLDQQFKDRVGSHISPYLDEIYLSPSKPKNGFLAEFDLKNLCKITGIELKKTHDLRIVCSDEFNLINAGKLRKKYGLSGYTDEDFILYRNKVLMKKLLIQNGIRVPRFKLLKRNDTFNTLAKEIGLPFVIKPVDSCGSHGVYIIRDMNDFNKFRLKSEDNNDEIEIEEYIEGTLYHVDSCIREGQIKFICANEYTCPNHDYTKGKVLGSIPLDRDNILSERLIDFSKKTLHVLGFRNLVNHMELFVTKNNEIVFLEVSARPPGALVNLTHRMNFGINLMDEDFFMQTDADIDIQNNKSNIHTFWALFPLRAGKIVKLCNPLVKSRFDITWAVENGKIIEEKSCQNIVNKAGHAIFYNPDKKILQSDFEKIRSHQALEIEPL